MRQGDSNCIVSQEQTTKAVLQAMTSTQGRPGAASIIGDNGELLGIFTDGDLRRHLEQGTDFLDKPISEVMTSNPKVITDDVQASTALELLTFHKIDQVIVINGDNQPVGMVDIQDLV